jgi:phospholipid/cholesterol/gamma-HCH transport system substrate-binding protein
MRRTRGDLIRVGLFVVIAGGILAGGLLWIAGSRLLRPVDTYTVLFRDSVSGLNAGSNVEYQGVIVGRVRDIRLTKDIPPQVAVIIDVEPGTPIRTDTFAALLGSIVTGIQYIQLQGGSAEAEALPPGGVIRGDVTSLQVFRDRLTRIADLAVSILTRLDEHVFTPENTAKVSEVVTDLGTVARSLSAAMETFQAEETGKNVAELVDKITEVTDNVNAVITDFYQRREQVYGTLDSTLRNVDAAVLEARDLLRVASTEVGGAGGSIGALLQELTAATERLQETLDLIRTDPSVLLWGRSVPERELQK